MLKESSAVQHHELGVRIFTTFCKLYLAKILHLCLDTFPPKQWSAWVQYLTLNKERLSLR